MFRLFRKRKLREYANGAEAYIQKIYRPYNPHPNQRFSIDDESDDYLDEEPKVQYSLRNYGEEPANPKIKHSKKDVPSKPETGHSGRNTEEGYNAAEISYALKSCSAAFDYSGIHKTLEKNVNQSFVDKLLQLIEDKGVRDSKIYKAANVDKRLFSKMVSDRHYKPSKDTAVAFALALELSLSDANDLLSRAGYVLSHSNKRDIIIEYFFRERIYNLMDANNVLHQLEQKLIGRL